MLTEWSSAKGLPVASPEHRLCDESGPAEEAKHQNAPPKERAAADDRKRGLLFAPIPDL
jgi:hypothetical protein